MITLEGEERTPFQVFFLSKVGCPGHRRKALWGHLPDVADWASGLYCGVAGRGGIWAAHARRG